MKAQTAASLVALLAGLQQVTATGWLDFPAFKCPQNSHDNCNAQQYGGFDWSDLPTGDFSFYGGFEFEGFTCSNNFDKRDALSGRTFGSKCISGVASSEPESCPKASCSTVDSFSIDIIQISVEFDCDLEFHYGMDDGSTCKQKSSCSSQGTTVKNTQCGGAKNVTVVLPTPPANKPSCSVGIHSIGFNCPTTTSAPVVVTTTSSAAITTTTSSAAITTTSSSAATTTTTSSAAVTTTTSPAAVVTTSTTSQAAVVTTSTTSPAAAVSTTSTSPAAVVTTSTTSPAAAISTTSTSPAAGTTTTSPAAVVTTSTTSPAAAVTTTTSPAAVTTSTTSPAAAVSTTSTSSSPVTAAASSTSAQSVTTVIIDTTVTTCPVTNTITSGGVTTTQVSMTVSTVTLTRTSTICTRCEAATSTSAVPAISTSSAPAPPQATAPCPAILPSCLNTWLTIDTECTSSDDKDCYCPNSNFTTSVFGCLSAHGASDAEVAAAQAYFQGICAQYVPQNPAIVTAAPVTVTATPYAGAVTTIDIYTTVVVPCTQTNGPASTTSVISSALTVPQVVFTTMAGTSGVGLFPGTATPAVTTAAAPAYVSTTMATVAPTQTASSGNGTATIGKPAAFTGGASRSGVAFSVVGAAMVFVFAL